MKRLIIDPHIESGYRDPHIESGYRDPHIESGYRDQILKVDIEIKY